MPRRGRTYRYREARQFKHAYHDELFREGTGTLADMDAQSDDNLDEDDSDLDDGFEDDEDWDPDHHLG